MGIKERKARRKQEVRGSILDAAVDIIEEKGANALTIRSIAERIEYSPSVIYEYFVDKEAIFEELRCSLLREMLAGLKKVEKTVHAEDYFLNLGRFMWVFYSENIERYALSVSLRKMMPPKEIREMREILGKALQALKYPIFKEMWAVDEAINVLRAFLEGLGVIVVTQRLHGGMTEAYHLLDSGLKTLLKGWQSQC